MAHAQNLFLKPSSTRERVRYHSSPIIHGIAREIDALHFVGHAAPIPLLFQFANFEQLFDKTSMEHYAATATDPKKVLYYDAGHDLNDPQALQDRYDWLAKYIDLRRLPIVSSSAPQVQAP